MTGQSKPSMGRIVHFRRARMLTVPAIVREVAADGSTCDLTAFTNSGATPYNEVKHSPEPTVDGWFWPPREG